MSIIEQGTFFLYRHIRLDTNKPFYVGMSTKNLLIKKFTSVQSEYKRAYSTRNRSKYWNDIVNITNYKIEILLESDDHDFITKKEIEFIQLYGREDIATGILCNLTDGGKGMLNINRDIIKNLCREGCKMPQEAKDKISKANKGRIITWGNKISITNTGRIMSEEAKEKIRIYQNNNKKCGKDNKFSKRVTQIDRKTNEIIKIWDCANDVKNEWNLKSNHISLCCKGKIHYCYGYKWEYTD